MLWQVKSKARAACFEASWLLLEGVRSWDTKAFALMEYPCKSFSYPITVFHLTGAFFLLPSLTFTEVSQTQKSGQGRRRKGCGGQTAQLHKLHFLRK